ncbi:MAG: transporter [Cyclobacteriaceae bacterium]|nr:transporter [Cyclobacteriaceae bacterium]
MLHVYKLDEGKNKPYCRLAGSVLFSSCVTVLVRFAVIFLVLLIGRGAGAQENQPFENLSIDRPDVSNLPVTVRPGHYQIEMGMEYDKNTSASELYLPNFMLRTGLGKKTELRLGTYFVRIDSAESAQNERLSGFSGSVKHRIAEEKGARPAIAIQPEVNYLSGRDDASPLSGWTYDFLLLFNNTFHRQVFLNYNLGFYWIGSGEKRILLSASLSFLHTHRLGYFVEGYTLRTWEERTNFSFDGGITYLVAPRFQFDIYAGKRWALGSSFLFVGGGVGFRIDRGDVKPKSFKEIGIHH